MKKNTKLSFYIINYCLLVMWIFGAITAEAAAINVLPPKYLSVKNFQKCLGTKSMGTWDSWCLPAKKPHDCLKSSWEELNGLQKTAPMPSCSR